MFQLLCTCTYTTYFSSTKNLVFTKFIDLLYTIWIQNEGNGNDV